MEQPYVVFSMAAEALSGLLKMMTFVASCSSKVLILARVLQRVIVRVQKQWRQIAANFLSNLYFQWLKGTFFNYCSLFKCCVTR